MNKKTFQKGSRDNDLTFPITQEQIDNLKECDLVNPMVGKHHGVKVPDDFDEVSSAKEILKVRLEVQKGIFPWWFLEKYWPYNFPMPKYLPKAFEMNGLSFDNPQGCADIVHMDDPLDLPLSQKKALTNPKYGGTANIKKGYTKKYKQFLETVVNINETITDFQKRYGKKVFENKAFNGGRRPEEIEPELGALMTAYEEGSPCHGENGHGHGAFAQAGFKGINNDLKLNVDQIKNGLWETFAWAIFRSFAGVHHGMSVITSIILVGGFEKYYNKKITDKFIR